MNKNKNRPQESEIKRYSDISDGIELNIKKEIQEKTDL